MRHYPSLVQAPARQTVTAYVALGSNLGDRAEHLGAALRALGLLPGTRVSATSPVIETEPVGGPPQGRFLNAAAELRSALPPRDLLGALLEIERSRGRERSREQRWGPRALDLDLLLYGDALVSEPGLTIPHPRLHERRFVLEPLAAIAPGVTIPTLGITVGQALRALHASVGSVA
jgi:2-amino-4-hydroxy-6-hydroxymethyldihydropteridine diphosphokinase